MLTNINTENSHLTEIVQNFLKIYGQAPKEILTMKNLLPVMELMFSLCPDIRKANPTQTLQSLMHSVPGRCFNFAKCTELNIERHPAGELQEDLSKFIERIEVFFNGEADKSKPYSKVMRVTDYELAFAHMPEPARKIIASSRLTYEEIRDHPALIVDILLFLTSSSDWPSALFEYYRYPRSDIMIEKPIEFIREDPRKTFFNKTYIGRGTFAEVFSFRGKKQQFNCLAAKCFIKNYSQIRSVIESEISILCSVQHKNIVQFVNSYLFNDNAWIIMDYCDGGSLSYLLKFCSLSEPQIAYFAREILFGLSHLHANSIVHRDIKSGNILLYLDGRVTIGFFSVFFAFFFLDFTGIIE